LVDNLKEVDEIEEILEVKYEDERKISERFVSIKNETNWTTAYNYIEDVLDNYYLESIIGPHKIDGHDLFKSYYKYQNGKLIKEKHFNKEGVVLLYKEHKDGEPILIIEYAKIPYNVKSPDYIETRISNNLITDERYYHRKVNLTEGEKNELKLTKQITFIYNENKNIVSKNYYQFNDKEEKVLVKKETTVYTECKIRDNKERIIKNYQLPIEIISLIRVENEGGESAEFEETSKTIKIYYPNSINLFEEKYFIENKLLKHVFYEYQNDNCIEKRTRHYNIANDTLDSSELESIDYDVSGDVTFHLMIKISGNEIVNKTTKHFYYSND
jgi:hypothetical protein